MGRELWKHSERYAAAAAKSCWSGPILCNPIDGGPPGSRMQGLKNLRASDLLSHTQRRRGWTQPGESHHVSGTTTNVAGVGQCIISEWRDLGKQQCAISLSAQVPWWRSARFKMGHWKLKRPEVGKWGPLKSSGLIHRGNGSVNVPWVRVSIACQQTN